MHGQCLQYILNKQISRTKFLLLESTVTMISIMFEFLSGGLEGVGKKGGRFGLG